MEPPCWYSGDHYWHGGSCSVCGKRLRCGACQRFVTVENLDRHLDQECPVTAALDRKEKL